MTMPPPPPPGVDPFAPPPMQPVAPPRYPCPCCGHLVFKGPPGSKVACPICYWLDDASQLRWPAITEKGNIVSLVEGQENVFRYGACEMRFMHSVREPEADEIKEQGWRPCCMGWDRFENPAQTQNNPWPPDPTGLYWWRTTFWLGARGEPPPELAPQMPEREFTSERKAARDEAQSPRGTTVEAKTEHAWPEESASAGAWREEESSSFGSYGEDSSWGESARPSGPSTRAAGSPASGGAVSKLVETIAPRSGSIEELLRRGAFAIGGLGNVAIDDIVFTPAGGSDGAHRLTVYYHSA